ncbi:HAD family phosphatase [Sinirhodobacter populi]|uniref:HAD family phosphatase n=1 Tax=Paenirhodobacter populi TaxID=2306993 RepID=A0A443KKS6_9RHOB|nr:HAD family phosphatase [Sinirhodobacter populi]RWR33377.1 HAD family phosphatase [Sinirhodobacter populi]
MKPQAVLFDCDGVLVDSEPVTFALIQEDFAAHGLHMTIPELEPLFIGHTIEETGNYARAHGADLPAGWADSFYDRMCERLAQGTALMPGVPELLDALDRAGVPYAVGSNGRMQKMRATLGQHPAIWAKLKDRLFSGQDLGCPKPAPDLYLTAARALNADPAHCVVMEDTPTGARAGIAAGMRVLGYAPHDVNPDLRAVGAEIVTSMFEVPRLLNL